jgi:hypothetical protein
MTAGQRNCSLAVTECLERYSADDFIFAICGEEDLRPLLNKLVEIVVNADLLVLTASAPESARMKLADLLTDADVLRFVEAMK